MPFRVEPWQDDTKLFTLTDGYTLIEADPQEWGIYYSVYYNMEYNGFFRDQGLTMEHWRRKFWISRGDSRIGGVVVAPNVIFGLFFIPPFREEAAVVRLLKQLLLAWSDRGKRITAYDILPDQLDWFAQAGFWPGAFRCRWMQRPTERLQAAWGDDVAVMSPRLAEGPKVEEKDKAALIDAETIGLLLYEGFKNGIDADRRDQRNAAFHLEDVRHYSAQCNDETLAASTLVYDRATNELIGVCLVSWEGTFPAVYSIAVHPTYRRRGIATNMLKRALSVLHGRHPILRLYVMQGNEAEAAYAALGFKQGVLEAQICYIPPLQQQEVGGCIVD